jgi:hypothetical protein
MRRLLSREKTFLALGGAVVAVTLVAGVLRGSVLDQLELLDRQIAVREAELGEMQALVARQRGVQARLRALELRLARQQDDTFLSQLDSLIAQAQLQGHMDAFQPQRDLEQEGFVESTVEVKFSRLSLWQVVGLLRQLSSGESAVRIRRVGIERRFENPQELDLALVLSSYRVKR